MFKINPEELYSILLKHRTKCNKEKSNFSEINSMQDISKNLAQSMKEEFSDEEKEKWKEILNDE